MEEYKLTNHALDRLKERSSLQPGYILAAIKEGQLEIITAEKFTNRISHLLFSADEEKFHVLVIDTAAQEIITIMPIEYWENLKSRAKEDRIRNGKSVTIGDLFNAVRKVDVNHRILQHPPLCGREMVHFFARFTKEKKIRSKKIGSVAISEFIGSEKESCIKELRSCFDSGLQRAIPVDELTTVSWRTTPKNRMKETDREHGVDFDYEIDFDILYRAVVNDLRLRIENTKRYPDFQFVAEKTGSA